MPNVPRDQLMLQLRLINDAQERGATWADIAKTLGFSSAKIAKNTIKKSARALERTLRAEMEKGVVDGNA